MLTDEDIARMQAEIAEVRADREVEISLRRGDTTLEPQSFRLESVGQRGFQMRSAETREQRGNIMLLGAVDADVQVDDRFTDNGKVCRVVYIRPNRQVMTVAEAVEVQ